MSVHYDKLVKFGNDLWYLFTENGVIFFMNISFIILIINTLSMVKNKDENIQKYKTANIYTLMFFAFGVLTFFLKILLNRK